MPTLLRSKTPRARKPHRCSCCHGAIPIGATYDRDTFIYDGIVYDWLTCVDCEPLLAEVYRWVYPMDDEGIGPEDYEEWARAHVDDPKHGAAARALLDRRAGSVTPERGEQQ
jgi:hypothetical protein